MKIRALTQGRALIACGVCLLTAGVAAAQTAAPAAKPTAVSAPAAPSATRRKPHHDGHPAPPHAPSFDELDTNHDGVVSKAEFDAWRAAHPMPGRPGPDDDDRRSDGDGGPRGWGDGFEMRNMMWMRRHEMEMHPGGGGRFGPPLDLEAADTDHDGKISWAEFQAAATAHLKARFDRLDANHDGFIEKDEMPGHGDRHDHDSRWHHEDGDDKAAANPVPAAPAK